MLADDIRPLHHVAPGSLPETQCDYRDNRSTMDMILCLRHFTRKVKRERHTIVYGIREFHKGVSHGW